MRCLWLQRSSTLVLEEPHLIDDGSSLLSQLTERFLNRVAPYPSFKFRCLTSATWESPVTNVLSSDLSQGANIYLFIYFGCVLFCF